MGARSYRQPNPLPQRRATHVAARRHRGLAKDRTDHIDALEHDAHLDRSSPFGPADLVMRLIKRWTHESFIAASTTTNVRSAVFFT